MKKALIISLLVALAGLNLRADTTFTAAYVDTDGLNQIGSQNNLTFYWSFNPAGSTTWTWAVFGWQGNWNYCSYDGAISGPLVPSVDDGTNLTFSTAQFGGVSPDCLTTGNSITNVMFAEGAATVDINLNLDSSGTNLPGGAATIPSGAPHVSIRGSLPLGFMQMRGQFLGAGDMQISCGGIAGTNYALDRTFSLAAPDWAPQATNAAGVNGVVVFTNTPDATTNNFWRVRSVP